MFLNRTSMRDAKRALAAAKANAERTRLALNNNVNATQANPIALATLLTLTGLVASYLVADLVQIGRAHV